MSMSARIASQAFVRELTSSEDGAVDRSIIGNKANDGECRRQRLQLEQYELTYV
jgi:hypothetical protein